LAQFQAGDETAEIEGERAHVGSDDESVEGEPAIVILAEFRRRI